MGCIKNLKRRQRFYLHINRSGQSDLTSATQEQKLSKSDSEQTLPPPCAPKES